MSDQGMKVKKQVISILFLTAIMAITCFVCLRGYSIGQMLDALKNADYSYLLAGLGMMILFVLCEATNIYLITKVLGEPTSFRRCFEYSCIGFYFSSITPSASGGQPAQIYYMKKDKISINISSITIFYIMLVYQIAMIFLGIAAVIFSYGTTAHFISKLKYLLIIGTVINTGAIFLIFAFMFSKKILPGVLSFLITAGKKLRIVKNENELRSKMEQSMASYHEKALIIKKHPILFFQVFFVSLVQMIALNLIPLLVYKSMGYHAGDLIGLVACQSLLTIAVSAIPLPGAEGVSQGGFLQVFGMFFSHNVLAYAMIINRIVSFYLPLLLSFFVYIYTHLRTTRQYNKVKVAEG